MYQEKIGPLRLWQWLVALAAVATALRLVVVFRTSMWIDDGATLETIALPYGELVAERFRMGHIPWFFVLFKAWAQIAGMSLLALKLPSLVASLLALPVVAALAGRLSGARGALIAAAIFVIHGSLLRHAAELRMYGWMGFLGGALLLAAIRHMEKPAWSRAALLGAVHLVLLQIHISAVFFTLPVLGAVAVLSYRQKSERAYWLGWLTALVVPLLLTLPVLLHLRSQVDPGEYEKFRGVRPAGALFQTVYELVVSLGERGRGWELAIGYVYTLVCVGVVRVLRRNSGRHGVELALVYLFCGLAAPHLTYGLSLAGVHVFGEPRYYIGGTAALLALAGGAAGCLRWEKQRTSIAAMIVFLAASIVVADKMRERVKDVLLTTGMGLNQMAWEIQAEVPPGTLVVISDKRQVPAIARYYFGEKSGYRFLELSREATREEQAALLRGELREGADLVLYLYREDNADYGKLETLVREDFGPWTEVHASDDDQPKWMWFRKGTETK